MQPLTRAQVRQVDERAITELGIPGIVLMENAARGASEVLQRLAQPHGWNTAALLCGSGNNGGDGYAVARLLHNAGWRVELFAAADPARLQGDARINADICQRMGLPTTLMLDEAQLAAAAQRWGSCPVLIDALLGTGFQGPVRPHLAAVITQVNRARAAGAFVLALDVPSGLDCDAGVPSNAAVEADCTVTFVAPKLGFTDPSAAPFLGMVEVAGIGVPPSLIERVRSEA